MSRQLTITSPSGVTLKTKNKYMDDDVAVQVDGAENVLASNIKKDVSILGVSGTYEGFVPSGSVTISENGTYNISAFAEAVVSVPGLVPSGTLEISSNGVYDIGTYASASVNVPQISTEPTIDGLCNNLYSEVTLNASNISAPFLKNNDYVNKIILTQATSICNEFCCSAKSLMEFSASKLNILGSSAFYDCVLLSSFYLPELKKIAASAFYNCSKIAITDFNYSNFTYCGNYPFQNTKNITLSYMEFTNLSILNGNMFFDIPHTQSIFLNFPQAFCLESPFSFGYTQGSSLFGGFSAPKIEGAGNVVINMNSANINISFIYLPSIAFLRTYFAQYTTFNTIHLGCGTQIILDYQFLFYNTHISSIYYNSIAPTIISNATNEALFKSSYVSSIYIPKQCLEEYKTATNWAQRANDFIPYDFGNIIEAVGKDIASGTSLSLSINCNVGDDLILCVTYRANAITVPDWTLIYESDNYYSGGTQKQAIFIKTATSSIETASITVTASGRVYACICNIKNKTASVDTNMCLVQIGDLSTTKYITKTTDNDVLFFVGNVFFEATTGGYDKAFDAYHGCGITGEFEQICAFGRDYRAVMYYSKVPKNNTAMTLSPDRPVMYGQYPITTIPGNFGITAIELSEPEE